MKFFASYRKSDNLVIGIQQAMTQPIDTADRALLEITQSEYNDIGTFGLSHEQAGPPSSKFDGVSSIVKNEDPRTILEVRFPAGTEVMKDAMTEINIRARDKDGNPISITEKFLLGLVIGASGRERLMRIQITDGNFNISRTFTESGHAQFVTTGGYRLQGDITFDVIEDFA